MNTEQFDFLFAEYKSFEEFQMEISTPENKNRVHESLKHLNSVENMKRLIDLVESCSYSNFFVNLLLLYQWMVSEDYKDFEEEDIDILYKFLNRVRIPDFAVRKINWGVVFLKREKKQLDEVNEQSDKEHERWDEEFWEKLVLQYIDKMPETSSAVSHRLSLWLMYHIGLKQLFKSENSNHPHDTSNEISGTMEKVLIRYINLVDQYPELEDIFGITIEKDMHRLYDQLSRRQHD